MLKNILKSNDINEIEKFLSDNPDFKPEDLLEKAILNGYPDTILLLLKAYQVTISPLQIIDCLVYRNPKFIPIIEYLFDIGYDFNVDSGLDDDTTLIEKIAYHFINDNYYDKVKFILQNNLISDSNVSNELFHYACTQNKLKIVKLLMDYYQPSIEVINAALYGIVTGRRDYSNLMIYLFSCGGSISALEDLVEKYGNKHSNGRIKTLNILQDQGASPELIIKLLIGA
jgi:hypothetical protein